jgi:hypothetical protein
LILDGGHTVDWPARDPPTVGILEFEGGTLSVPLAGQAPYAPFEFQRFICPSVELDIQILQADCVHAVHFKIPSL